MLGEQTFGNHMTYLEKPELQVITPKYLAIRSQS